MIVDDTRRVGECTCPLCGQITAGRGLCEDCDRGIAQKRELDDTDESEREQGWRW